MLNKQTTRYVIGTMIGIFIYEVLDESQIFAKVKKAASDALSAAVGS